MKNAERLDIYALETACRENMQQNGLPLNGPLIVDGTIHRYSADEKRNKPDEWYVAYDNPERPGALLLCIYGSWSDGSEYEFRSWEHASYSGGAGDRSKYAELYKSQREQLKIEQEERYKRVAQEAQRIWQEASLEPPAPAYLNYIRFKQVEPIGVRFCKNPQGYPAMVVPLHDVDGIIQSLQFISINMANKQSYKTFLNGGRKNGNFFVLGDISSSPITFIAEGYATAVSVYLGMKKLHAVVVAFDAGNIRKVVALLRDKYPTHTFLIAGDDDDAGRGAGDGVSVFRCKAVYPTFPADKRLNSNGKAYTDFNDLYLVCGADEVCKQLEAAINLATQEQPLEAPSQASLVETKLGVPEKENICAKFSISNLPPVLCNYVDSIAQTTGAHPIMIVSSILAMTSGFLKKHVYMPEGEYYQELYPNLWLLNVTQSGQFKTTALSKGARIAHDRAAEIAREIRPLRQQLANTVEEGAKADLKSQILELSLRDVCLPNKITTEALLEHLAQGHAGVIYTSEFGAWLQGMEANYNLSLKSTMTELFDVPPVFSYKTRTQGDHKLERPYISICGVSTMPWVKQHIRPDDITNGFFARFLIFTPPHISTMPAALPAQYPAEQVACHELAEREVKNVLDIVCGANRAYTLPKSARKLFGIVHEYIYQRYREQEERMRELLDPYVKRWSPYVLKLAMNIRPFEDPHSTELSDQSIFVAASIVDVAMRSTIQLFDGEFGESEHQKKCRKVHEAIIKNTQDVGGILRKKLLQSKILSGGSNDYDAVLTTLEESGLIIVTSAKPKAETAYVASNIKVGKKLEDGSNLQKKL